MHSPDDIGHYICKKKKVKQNIKSLAQFMGFWTISPLNYLRSNYKSLSSIKYISALLLCYCIIVTCFSRTGSSSSSEAAILLLLSTRPCLLIVSCSCVRCSIVWQNSFKWHYSRGIAGTLQSDSATTERLLYAHTQLNKTFQKMALLIFSIVAE